MAITKVTKQVNSQPIHHSKKKQQQQVPQNQGGKPPFKLQKWGEDQQIKKGQQQQKPNYFHKKLTPVFVWNVAILIIDQVSIVLPKVGHFTKLWLSSAAQVNETNLDLAVETAYQQTINALNASSQIFYIFNVKEPKSKAKRRIYTNIKIDGTENYLWAKVNTAANVNLMPTTVYTQICEDPNLDRLGPMDTDLSVYNDSAICAFGTCIIPLILPIDGHTHETKFYVAHHYGIMLFSCEDSWYLQIIQPHPAFAKQIHCNAHFISSEHDTAYANFI